MSHIVDEELLRNMLSFEGYDKQRQDEIIQHYNSMKSIYMTGYKTDKRFIVNRRHSSPGTLTCCRLYTLQIKKSDSSTKYK
jgi:hypothetical protein